MQVLFCTVGGSPQPIVSAIRASRPGRVMFICSDGSRGSESSESQVPNIASEAALKSDAWEIVSIPPDDPDAAILVLRDTVTTVRGRYPKARVLADYTGGTKSMSAALLHVAIATGIQVQFMVGIRQDLEKVRDGSERPARLSLDFAIAERSVGRLIEAWDNFGYASAAAGFSEILADIEHVDGVPKQFIERVKVLGALSKGFAAWHRFDHKIALETLHPLAGNYTELAPFIGALHRICDAQTLGEPALLFDLWNNAMRTATRGLFDDATARIYRLLEWAAQWMLRVHLDVDTGDVDLAKLHPDCHHYFDTSRLPVQVAMGKAWALVESQLPDRHLRKFMRSKTFKVDGKTNREHRKRWAEARNYSILAHGRAPIDAARWEREILPFARRFVEALRHEAESVGHDFEVPQLPRKPPSVLCG